MSIFRYAIGFTSACSIAAGSRPTCPTRRNAGNGGPIGAASCASAVLGAILVAVAALGLIAWKQTGEARKANKDLREANDRLEEQFYARSIILAERELTFDQDVGIAGSALRKCPEHLRGWEWRYLMGRLEGCEATGQALVLEAPRIGPLNGLWKAVFSPDGAWLPPPASTAQ